MENYSRAYSSGPGKQELFCKDTARVRHPAASQEVCVSGHYMSGSGRPLIPRHSSHPLVLSVSSCSWFRAGMGLLWPMEHGGSDVMLILNLILKETGGLCLVSWALWAATEEVCLSGWSHPVKRLWASLYQDRSPAESSPATSNFKATGMWAQVVPKLPGSLTCQLNTVEWT